LGLRLAVGVGLGDRAAVAASRAGPSLLRARAIEDNDFLIVWTSRLIEPRRRFGEEGLFRRGTARW
jgi:hypothetical protein